MPTSNTESPRITPQDWTVLNLVLACERAGVELPAELSAESINSARYAGEPEQALLLRLDGHALANQSEHIKDLVGKVGIKTMLEGLVRNERTFSHKYGPIIADLVAMELLPAGDALLDLVAEAGADAKTVTLMLGSLHHWPERLPSASAYLRVAQGYRFGLRWVLEQIAAGNVVVDDTELEQLHEALSGSIMEAIYERRSHVFTPYAGYRGATVLADDQIANLLGRNTPAASVLLAHLASYEPEIEKAIVVRFGGLAILSQPGLHMSESYRNALFAAARSNSRELDELDAFGFEAKRWLLDNVELSSKLLLAAITPHAKPWLCGGHLANQPTPNLVAQAADAGLLTGEEVVMAAGFNRDRSWVPVALELVPGVAAAMTERASRTWDGSAIDELVALMPYVAEIMKRDERLWERFLGVRPSSPFADAELSVEEAAQIFLERWAAAEARKASTS